MGLFFIKARSWCSYGNDPDSKVHGANIGPTRVLSAPDGPHVGPMNRAIKRGSVSSEHGMMNTKITADVWFTHLIADHNGPIFNVDESKSNMA